MRQWKHKAQEPDIVYQDDTVAIDVRAGGSDHIICAMATGSSIAWVIGSGTRADCERVAIRLSRHPGAVRASLPT